jgi:leucyl/phenylalanyl-tRNA---protein transferase
MRDVRMQALPVRADSAGPFSGLRLTSGEDLVAAGGPLSADLLLHAYRHGVFPWYDAEDPPLWWCPDPRAVLPLSALHVPTRLARTVASQRFRLTADTCFDAVVRACARGRAEGTWIHPAMARAYGALHRRGHARSFEVWLGADLVGGLYGVAVPPVFCAESKFHTARDASKVALVHACRTLASEGYTHLEVQFLTPHLAQFGVIEISRRAYLKLLTPASTR